MQQLNMKHKFHFNNGLHHTKLLPCINNVYVEKILSFSVTESGAYV